MKLELFNTDNLDLFRVGGAISGNSTQIADKYFNSKKLPGRSRDVVVISSHLKEKLNEIEYKAIYYHEEGHYVLKHNTNDRMHWKTKELQADEYSSKIVGPRNLLTGLLKIPSIIRTCKPLEEICLKNMSEQDYRDSINSFLSVVAESMQFRYDVLKKALNDGT